MSTVVVHTDNLNMTSCHKNRAQGADGPAKVLFPLWSHAKNLIRIATARQCLKLSLCQKRSNNVLIKEKIHSMKKVFSLSADFLLSYFYGRYKSDTGIEAGWKCWLQVHRDELVGEKKKRKLKWRADLGIRNVMNKRCVHWSQTVQGFKSNKEKFFK